MWSQFFPCDNEGLTCSTAEVERQMLDRFPDAKVDWERGDEWVAKSLQDMIDLGTPEVIYRGHKTLFGRTIYIEIPIVGFSGHRFHAICHGFDFDGIFCFEATPFNLDLLKTGSRVIADAMHLDFRLAYDKSCGGLRIACSASQDSPVAMARAEFPGDRWNTLRLTELVSWSDSLRTAVREWLRQYPTKYVIDTWLHGFESPDAFVNAVVREVGAIGVANHAWRIDFPDGSHQSAVIIEQEHWMTFLNLSGVRAELIQGTRAEPKDAGERG